MSHVRLGVYACVLGDHMDSHSIRREKYMTHWHEEDGVVG